MLPLGSVNACPNCLSLVACPTACIYALCPYLYPVPWSDAGYLARNLFNQMSGCALWRINRGQGATAGRDAALQVPEYRCSTPYQLRTIPVLTSSLNFQLCSRRFSVFVSSFYLRAKPTTKFSAFVDFLHLTLFPRLLLLLIFLLLLSLLL